MSKKIIVGGSTGAVGRYCVNLLVKDPRVETVFAVIRSEEKSFDFFGLTEEEAKSKLKQTKVDFKTILENEDFKSTVRGSYGIISCLGVYSASVKNQEDFFKQEYEPNMSLAKFGSSLGIKKFGYLSGQGVYVSESKGFFQPMFSWVKGSIERDLQKEMDFVVTARPGGIGGRPNGNSFGDKLINNIPYLMHTSLGIHRDDISKALVYSMLNETEEKDGKKEEKDSKTFLILETNDLKKVARKYDEYLKSIEKKITNLYFDFV